MGRLDVVRKHDWVDSLDQFLRRFSYRRRAAVVFAALVTTVAITSFGGAWE